MVCRRVMMDAAMTTGSYRSAAGIRRGPSESRHGGGHAPARWAIIPAGWGPTRWVRTMSGREAFVGPSASMASAPSRVSWAGCAATIRCRSSVSVNWTAGLLSRPAGSVRVVAGGVHDRRFLAVGRRPRRYWREQTGLLCEGRASIAQRAARSVLHRCGGSRRRYRRSVVTVPARDSHSATAGGAVL